MSIIYEVLEADTIEELQKMVQTRMAIGAVLEGGVATAAVVVAKNAFDNEQICQTFYQAVTYDAPDESGSIPGEVES